MHGAPKPVVTGRKGNVGGISTPGRHGHKLTGLTALVKPGPGTKKTATVANLHRPEGNVSVVKTAGAKRSGSAGPAAGSPKHITSSGHKGIHIGTRPEGSIKRDSASVVKA